jgi:amidase
MSAVALDDYPAATALVAALARRALGVEELMAATLARIEQLNPRVNAIVSLDPERALAQARRYDQDFARHRGEPLFGLPVAVKDLAQTAGWRTTFGSPLYRDFVPDLDDLFVSRLKAAGAIVIGKTNTPEFGAGSQTFNPVFGATRNPYDLSRTAGGSSGGAAAALACGLLALADGSDLGGSLRNPAAFCNVIGFRPTPGRVPGWPRAMTSEPLAVTGPMARSLPDLALLLSVMAGPDPRVPLSLPEPGANFRLLEPARLRGLRVAWAPTLDGLPIEPHILRVLAECVPVLTDLGCDVHEVHPDLRDAPEIFRVLRAWQFAVRFGPDFARHRAHMKDTLVGNIEEGLRLTLAEVSAAEVARSRLIERVAAFFARYDFLVCAATQVLPFAVETEWVREIEGVRQTDYLEWMRVCWAITVTGCPAISVPAGFTPSGLPVGLQIVAPRLADRALLEFAYAFAAATGHAERHPHWT